MYRIGHFNKLTIIQQIYCSYLISSLAQVAEKQKQQVTKKTPLISITVIKIAKIKANNKIK